jgi:hypothetical protein
VHLQILPRSITVAFFCLLLTTAVLPPPVHAFGKNKVQYEDLSWRYFSAEDFDVYYHGRHAGLARRACCIMEDEYRTLSDLFGFTHKDRLPLLLYANPYLFQQTNVISSLLPEGVGGFTEYLKNRIVVPFNGSYHELDHVLRHELVHGFHFGIMRENQGMFSSGLYIPAWFAEGSAEFLSSGWNNEADMFLMDKVIFDHMPLPGPGLSSGYMAYKGGQSFLYFLATVRSDSVFRAFLHAFRTSKDVSGSIKKIYGKEAEKLGEEWIVQLQQNYWPELGKRTRPDRVARRITSRKKNHSRYNLKPRLSPDGTRCAYFTDAKDYTRIIIRDVEKNRKIREVHQFGYAGYFESFHPFRSGICWSPDGTRLAFVTKANGRDQIRILDIERNETDRIIMPDCEFVRSPDWSADGSALVFTGVTGDRGDLYIYDFSADTSRKCTDDAIYESAPRFSPDGSHIVYHAIAPGIAPFTGAATLHPERMQVHTSDIFVYDLTTDTRENITRSATTNETHASFIREDSLVFISDRNGINNIYALSLQQPDSARALTDFIGGCTGLDYAPRTNRLVFTLFQQQRWDVWIMDDPLRHMHTSALAPTKWERVRRDPSQSFFRPMPGDDSTAAPAGITTADTVQVHATADTAHDADMLAAVDADTLVTFEGDSPGPTGRTTAAGVDSAATDTVTGDTSAAQPRGATVNGDTASATVACSDSLCDTARTRPYTLRFSPDMAALGIGVSYPYGYGGSGVLVLSDLLGNHRISLAADLQGNFSNTGYAFGAYELLTYRMDMADSGYYDSRLFPYYTTDGIVGVKDTKYGGTVSLRYPFSLFSRVDVSVFASTITQNYAIDYNENVLYTDTTLSYAIVLPQAQYVYDNVVWGITGPVNGIRGKADVLFSPPVSHTRSAFVSSQIDLRTYFHIMRRYVYAHRVSAGASVPLGDKDITRQFFLGGVDNWLYWTLEDKIDLDNYDDFARSSSYSEQVFPMRGWDFLAFAGSRYAVYNTAFRFPFIENISLAWPAAIRIRYINGAIFADVGNAWFAEDEYEYIPLPSSVFGGVGFGLRVNLGMFVLKFDRAWKTDFSSLYGGQTYFSMGAEF